MNVLITGASSGIGYELSLRHAAAGDHVLLVGRNADKLFEVRYDIEQRGGTASVYPYDVGNPAHITALLKATEDVAVDVLVNNAGFGLFGEFLETDLDRELNMIDVNVRAVTHLAKSYAMRMKADGRPGRIVNIASTAAFQPGPLMAVYYATKAYVLSFSEALADELAPYGISVTAVCPGATKTRFAETANLEQSKLFRRPGVMDVKAVTEEAYRAYMKGKRVVIPGRSNALMANVPRFLPRRAVTRLVRSVQSPI